MEFDESYFGARRVIGKRGRGAGGKIPVFEILKRDVKVYTQIISNCGAKELLPIIEGKVDKDSVVYTDGIKSYDNLCYYGYKKYYRMKHSDNQFAGGSNHINGIDTFWELCKVRLSKFRGINKTTFYLHLKECEFRYGNRNKTDKELYLYILRLVRKIIKEKKLV